jgi:phage FluMu protein Com
MSLRVRCPHCGAALSVAATATGKTKPCPRCKELFAIPDETAFSARSIAAENAERRDLSRPQLPVPTTLPPLDSASTKCNLISQPIRRRRRSLIGPVIALCVVGAISMASAAYYLHKEQDDHRHAVAPVDFVPQMNVQASATQDDREHLAALVDWFIRLNRVQVATQEHSFWLLREASVNMCDGLKDSQERLQAEFDAVDAKLKKRWGISRGALRALNPRVADAAQALTDGSERAVAVALENSRGVLDAECAALQARTRAESLKEFAKTPIDLGPTERTTAAQRIAYEEAQRLLPYREEVARLEAEAKGAKDFAGRLPAAMRKRVDETHAMCMNAVRKLEETFKAVR